MPNGMPHQQRRQRLLDPALSRETPTNCRRVTMNATTTRLNPGTVKLYKEGDKVLQAPAEPINRPCRDKCERLELLSYSPKDHREYARQLSYILGNSSLYGSNGPCLRRHCDVSNRPTCCRSVRRFGSTARATRIWVAWRGLPGTDQGNHLRRVADPERLCGTDRLTHVAGREMPVMLLDHAGVGMTEVSSDHHQRHAVHDH
jgi:hypothetical protein